jgi:hypothetical protein
VEGYTFAPVASPRSWAIRGRTSSVENVPPTRSANSDRTSYGVERFPYTIRSAQRVARDRTSVKPTASRVPRRITGTPPTSVFKPKTTTASTSTRPTAAVNPTTRRPYCAVFLTTKSRSHSRYRKIASATATGTPIPMVSASSARGMRTISNGTPSPSSPSTTATTLVTTHATRKIPARVPTAASHLICWRSSPTDRLYRLLTAKAVENEAASATIVATATTPPRSGSAPGMATGLWIPSKLFSGPGVSANAIQAAVTDPAITQPMFLQARLGGFPSGNRRKINASGPTVGMNAQSATHATYRPTSDPPSRRIGTSGEANASTASPLPTKRRIQPIALPCCRNTI